MHMARWFAYASLLTGAAVWAEPAGKDLEGLWVAHARYGPAGRDNYADRVLFRAQREFVPEVILPAVSP
jgi:hypothetical protein